jgi:hypothetical protein
MAEIAEVQSVGTVAAAYTPKQLFGRLKTMEDLDDVVFYVPFVYSLVQDRNRSVQPTDVFSHLLTQVLGEHPLVITELAKPVFRVMPSIILTPEQKALKRTIYVAPKEAWLEVEEQLKLVTAVDHESSRFCAFRMYEEEIDCPLGIHTDKKINVWYCNLYGNAETYYFARNGADEEMYLHYAPPITEFIELGKTLLAMCRNAASVEEGYRQFGEHAEECKLKSQLSAVQKNDKLHETVRAKTLDESQLTAKQRQDCYEMIKLYRQLYPEST